MIREGTPRRCRRSHPAVRRPGLRGAARRDPAVPLRAARATASRGSTASPPTGSPRTGSSLRSAGSAALRSAGYRRPTAAVGARRPPGQAALRAAPGSAPVRTAAVRAALGAARRAAAEEEQEHGDRAGRGSGRAPGGRGRGAVLPVPERDHPATSPPAPPDARRSSLGLRVDGEPPAARSHPAGDRDPRRARRRSGSRQLAQECYDGDMDSCDDLYEQAEVDSLYELYGGTCAGRQNVVDADTVFCTAAFPED